MKRLVIVNLLLLAVVVGLVVQIFSLWWRAEVEVEQAAPRDAKAQRPDLPQVARRPAPPELASGIAEKDLFDQSRSAEKAPPPAVAVAPPPPVNLALLGVTVVGGGREALLKDQTQAKPLWMREGEELAGYKVSRIDPTAVLMTAPGGDQVTLVINVQKGQPGQAPFLGPAGVQPTPAAPTPGGRRVRAVQSGVPTPMASGRPPAADIKEKIERLREEARARRKERQQQKQQQ